MLDNLPEGTGKRLAQGPALPTMMQRSPGTSISLKGAKPPFLEPLWVLRLTGPPHAAGGHLGSQTCHPPTPRRGLLWGRGARAHPLRAPLLWGLRADPVPHPPPTWPETARVHGAPLLPRPP